MERLRRDPRWPFQEIEGQVVVLVPPRREVHQLDEVGSFVWACLQTARTLEEVVAAVCGEFEVAEERARRDVAEFLASLEEKGLVVRA
ncbi:MAG: PqqD family protein [Planctomycetota bacterium]